MGVVLAHATSSGPMPNACFQAFQGSYYMLSGFSRCSVLPKLSCCLLPSRGKGLGWGWGGGGHDDAHCRLHHLQPFKLFRVSVLPKLFHVACFQNGGVWGGVGVKH